MSYTFTSGFTRAMHRLNDEQRLAVQTVDGPVLVLAGPGTGKTQILGSRIGYILQNTDTLAHNILCLTYTDAGTIAMRDRLRQFIGPEAYNVPIYTFHGFCNSVIQENREKFNFFREVQPLDELERIEVLREVIDGFAEDHILKRHKGNQYYDLRKLNGLFDHMKKEHLDAKDIEDGAKQELEDALLDENMYYKRSGKGYKKGDLKQKDYDKLKDRLERTVAAAKEIDTYRDLLRVRGRYDYQDMINFVIYAFEHDADLLLDYQERYQYILVDEYQDTNGAQNTLLDLLCNYWDRPNVFVVGDDDQAIYGFQGANIKGIQEFQAKYDPKVVVLKENYRSTQQILNASQSLIGHNTERLTNFLPGFDKILTASGDYASDRTRPQILSFVNRAAEELYLIDELRQLQKEGKIDLSEVAVLYRNHRDVENLVSVLEKERFPINVRKKTNILEEPLIVGILTILRYIEAEYNRPLEEDYGLSEILFLPFVAVDKADVSELFYNYSGYLRAQDKEWIPLRRFIQNHIEAIPLNEPEQIVELNNLINQCLEWRSMETPQVLLEHVLTSFNVLEWFVKGRDRSWYLQLINTLFEFVKDITAKQPEANLGDVLAHLDRLQEEGVGLAINKIVTHQEGVHFITCHSAKGLEFERVYLIGLTADNWEKRRANSNQFYLPSGSAIKEEKDMRIEEDRRLFFVAMTRAKKNLVMTFSQSKNDGKVLDKSRFLVEVLEEHNMDEEQIVIDENRILDFVEKLMRREVALDEGYLDHAKIDAVLSNYSLSVTGLNKYLKCPISFYFENILRVPQARKTYLGYGNAIHETLEDAVNYYRKTNGELTHDQLYMMYERNLTRFASHFTKPQFESHLYIGKQTLLEYMKYYKHEWLMPDEVLFEHAISNVQVDGIPITGKLDKIEINKQQVTVIDYKTGKYDAQKLKPYIDDEQIGGEYWRQIVFYKLLLDRHVGRSWYFQIGVMDFVEKDKKTNKYQRAGLQVSTEDEAIVTLQIKRSFEAMRNHEFDKGCESEYCRWCNMIRDLKSMEEA